MSNELTIDEQIVHVLRAMNDAECCLMLDWLKTAAQAEQLIAVNLGTDILNRSYPWWVVANEYVGAHRQWRELMQRREDEIAQAERDARAALLASSPFKAGDRVVRRDGKVGIVRQIFISRDVVKAAVDWPAPHRIGGDGWHRSTIVVRALKAAS